MNAKGQLREALLKIMQDTPIDKVTVQGICEASQVSKQTFYRHYVDKYALLEDCFEVYVLKPFEEGAGGLGWYDALVRHFNNMRAQREFVRNGYLSSDVNGLFQADVRLTRAVVEGILAQHGIDVGEPLVHFAVDKELYGSIWLIRQWVLDGMAASDEEMARLIVDTVPEAIRPYLVEGKSAPAVQGDGLPEPSQM